MFVEGEAGIGKSRLLAHLAGEAAAAGCTVLEARASAFEGDLPYAVFTEALDGHLAGRRLDRLGLADPAALARPLPALGALAPEPAAPDRHRTHRALRDLLERLAAARPLVLCLDDLHWADPASVEALVALVGRPPAAPVLLAVAARDNQAPALLQAALAEALREHRLLALALAPLSEAEAVELVGAAAPAVYPEAGGNPFYLEQLARVEPAGAGVASPSADGALPPAVTAALAAELGGLGPDARRLLDAAAVAGDPFEPALAADVAEQEEAAALRALDVLLAARLVRPTSRAAALRLPPSRGPPGRLRRAARRLAAGGARARRGGARAARCGSGRARAPRRVRGACPATPPRSRCSRRPRRSCRARRRRPRRASRPPPAPAAGRGEGAAADAGPARGRPGGRRRRARSAGDAARGAAVRAGRRAAHAHGRAGQPGLVARRQRRRPAAPARGARRPPRRAVGGPDPAASRAQPDGDDGGRPAPTPATTPATRATTPGRSGIRSSSSRRWPAERSRACRRRRIRPRWRSPPRRSSGWTPAGSPRACPRSGCTAARAAASGSSTRRSRSSSAAPRPPPRPVASGCC